MITQALPNSSAFFQGQMDAQKGIPAPKAPKANANYDEHMYFRGFMQQIRKAEKTINNIEFSMA